MSRSGPGSPPIRGRGALALLWAALVFMACLAVAGLGYLHARRAQEAGDQVRLQQFGERLRLGLLSKLQGWEDVLLAARGLEAAHPGVGAKAWEAFTDQFQVARHPGMKSLVRIIRVPTSELDAFRRRGLAEGLIYDIRPPRMLVGTPEDQGYVVDAGDHYLIRYAAPQVRNTLALGLDVGANPVQRATADRARDLGIPALTGKLIFNDLGGKRPSAALFLPLYRGGGVPSTLEARRRLADGWLSVGVLLDDAFESVLQLAGEPVAFEVDDLTGPVPVPLWQDPRLASEPPSSPSAAREEQIRLGGRTWRVKVRALPAFFQEGNRPNGAAWGFAGLVTGTALALAVWSMAGARARAFILAQHLTRATREALQRFRALVENVPLGVIDWDPDQRVRDWNPAAEAMFGMSHAAAVGRSCADLGFPAHFGASLAAVLAAPRGQAGLQGSGTFLGQAGAELHGEWTHAPLRDGEGRIVGVITLIDDVTGHRQEEEARRLSQKLESLGVLAGGIAHDFNNLLLGISGNTELALEHLEDPVQRGHLERVLLATRRASELARQMLAYAGRATFQIRPLDLNAEVREILELLKASLPKIVRLEAELDPGAVWIEADKVQVHQILVNLVINGAEAIGDRPGTVCIRTAATEADEALLQRLGSSNGLPPGPSVCLTVEDDGTGMDAATQARIFDPFFTTKFTGRGLGLSSVLGILKGHRAGFTVNSQVGRGTRFQVYFPRIEAPPLPEPDTADLGGGEVPQATVLFVDDEPTLRELAQAALEAKGHRVILAADGLDAVERFLSAPEVDVVVLDLTMPRMGGLEAFRRIHATRPEVQVVLSSGYTELALDEAGPERPAAFLHKPYRVQELQDLVGSLLCAGSRSGAPEPGGVGRPA